MAPWTVTLRGLVMGDGTSYAITAPGITGLGIPRTRTADTERGFWSGDVGGDDVYEKRVLTIPVAVLGDDLAGTWALFLALKAAWAASPVDIPLAIDLEGTTITYNGRPRGMPDPDVAYLSEGAISCLCTFEALNPFALGEPIDTSF